MTISLEGKIIVTIVVLIISIVVGFVRSRRREARQHDTFLD